MSVHLYIERLVLDGLPIEQRQGPQLQAAIENELARLLIDGGGLAQISPRGAVASINGGAIQVASDADPAGLGRQIAAAIYGGLGERG